ncbi:hypothetical protein [Novosphingobium album (ex Liu et al. 2023)]|uniref:Uncharacterized protein n=1 Tax=Novosphingobium album (ex Liu et al. 2023) TaxID=3031130 RepID=A0ABT5WW84_9SPHN|nr:hypothetical protein [Novosphingobium album (ex Liu et al. 2023)]MDE8654166.1 hypothetical protein [Novosphingobium album (ex Liu et al. 2023)]
MIALRRLAAHVSRASRAALAGTLAVLACGSAQAADAPGPKPSPEKWELEAMYNYARCVVSLSPAGAEKALALETQSPEYRDALMRLGKGHGQCLAGSSVSHFEMGGVLFAGTLAEVLLQRKWNEQTLATTLHPPEPAVEARSEIEYTGMCLALGNPQGTSALVFSDPGSAAADEKLKSLAQQLATCVHQGKTLRINKAGLRAIIALAAYRLAGLNTATGKS